MGNNFSGAVTDSLRFILNETAVREAGIKDPVGKPFRLYKHKGTIVGVVKDFHFASMKQKIEPAVFFYEPSSSNILFVKTTGREASKAIAGAQAVWDHFGTATPFSYTFLNETFDRLYKSERQTGSLLNRDEASLAALLDVLVLNANFPGSRAGAISLRPWLRSPG